MLRLSLGHRVCAWALAMAALLACAASGADESDATDRRAAIKADMLAIQQYRAGLESVIRFADSRPDLFPTNRITQVRLLTREQKEDVWNAWKTFLDYSIALDSIRRAHNKTYLIVNRQIRDESFLAAYSAFLAQYRFSLALIKRVEKDPGLAVLLDDAVPELGLEKGAYGRFEFLVLNVARRTEYLAFRTIWVTMFRRSYRAPFRIDEDVAALAKDHVTDALLTFDNAVELIGKGGSTAWFPVQKGVSIWMGDTKVWRWKRSLINEEQLQAAAAKFLPGDVMLERREWFMSNVGLPGFWPHAVLYIGTPSDRKRFFDDPETREWVKAQGQPDGDFDALLAARYPAAYAQCAASREDSHPSRIVEAIGEGVLFSTLEHSAAADSLCAMRPRLSKKEKAVAIFRSFRYVGRPYDYNFDFTTDSAIVCTELVLNSYQACPDSRGLKFPVLNILGRPATPANELVRQFDQVYGTPEQQFDLVLFLDGQERSRRAVESTLDEFRASWRRPKWFIVTQGAGGDEPGKSQAPAVGGAGS